MNPNGKLLFQVNDLHALGITGCLGKWRKCVRERYGPTSRLHRM